MTGGRDPGDPIFLVGFMGAGKSSAGALLAARLGWELTDTDALVEQAEGRSIERIFSESGEGRFREREWEALRAQDGARRRVVATGGGLFLAVRHRAFVRSHGVSLWLDAPLEVIESRVAAPEGRPLWPAADPQERRALFERRRAAYALADLRVDAAIEGAEIVARALEDAWRTLCR
jgi:shikimate kinase